MTPFQKTKINRAQTLILLIFVVIYVPHDKKYRGDITSGLAQGVRTPWGCTNGMAYRKKSLQA